MYGLVLEGGGARGSYQAGVYKAIDEMGIEIGGVAGSSIGALNGALILQGDYQNCHDLWQNVSYSMLFDIDKDEIDKLKNITLSSKDLRLIGEKAKQIITNGGVDITPIKRLLDEHIDEEKIRKTNKDFGIVTVNLTGFKPVKIFLEDIPRGDLKKYLLASAYLPYFKFERIDGNIYLDGGFYDNLPYRMLVEKGYTDLILVRTNAPGITRKIDLKGINAKIIAPSDDIGRTYIYEAESARRNMKLGYFDGLRAFKELVGERYYIKSNHGEDFYLDYLLKIEEKKIREIERILRLEKLPYRRSLLEKIVPKLCDYLDIYKECTYEELLVYMLERSAAKYEIDRFKVYDFQELLALVEEGILKDKKDMGGQETQSRIINKIIDQVESIPIFNREEILTDIADIIFQPSNK